MVSVGTMMAAGTVWMLVVAILVVAGGVVAIVLAHRSRMLPPGTADAPRTNSEDGAIVELRERYARGEIDEDELDRRLGPLLRH